MALSKKKNNEMLLEQKFQGARMLTKLNFKNDHKFCFEF